MYGGRPWRVTSGTSTTPKKRLNLRALWDSWLVATIHLLAIGK